MLLIRDMRSIGHPNLSERSVRRLGYANRASSIQSAVRESSEILLLATMWSGSCKASTKASISVLVNLFIVSL